MACYDARRVKTVSRTRRARARKKGNDYVMRRHTQEIQILTYTRQKRGMRLSVYFASMLERFPLPCTACTGIIRDVWRRKGRGRGERDRVGVVHNGVSRNRLDGSISFFFFFLPSFLSSFLFSLFIFFFFFFVLIPLYFSCTLRFNRRITGSIGTDVNGQTDGFEWSYTVAFGRWSAVGGPR